MRTVGDQVQEEADVTAGGVLLPLTAKAKPIAGVVVRAGPGKLDEEGKRSAPKVMSGWLATAEEAMAHLQLAFSVATCHAAAFPWSGELNVFRWGDEHFYACVSSACR